MSFRLPILSFALNLPDMESSQVNVLITGGTGFIGSRLGLRCLAGEHPVLILGQENTPAESSNRKLLEEKGARIRLVSVTQKELLPELLEGVDVVYHLAAAQHEVNVPDQRFRDVNVQGTANLLEASVIAGVKRFVHGSTIGVYGPGMEGRIDEKSPLQPDNIYGKTKLEGEYVVLSFKDRLPVVILRIPKRTGRGSEVAETVQGDPEGRFHHDRRREESASPDPHRRPDRRFFPRGGTSGSDREYLRRRGRRTGNDE
jgi:nucleoside-diphosphate-sugar epimerase